MKLPTKAVCPECERVFDLLDEDDAGEWFYGHDCPGQEPAIATVPLSNCDTVATVEAADLTTVAALTWHRDAEGYAAAWSPATGGIVRMHRVVLGFGPDDPHVDHVNRDRLDNRRDNLRIARRADNNRNAVKPRAVVPYRGVEAQRLSDRFTARIRTDKGRLYLGSFPTAEEAARAYDEAAREHHGAYAVLNFPPRGKVCVLTWCDDPYYATAGGLDLCTHHFDQIKDIAP